jgi:serine/threonine-protein kinase
MTATPTTGESPATIPTQEGQIIAGKYRVERVLGQGGMGLVLAAHHLHLEQRVAIKFVLPEAAANAEARERFAREAKAAVKLKSEHVARVLDVGQAENGAPYMVMEYLEGADLGAIVESHGPLHPAEAVDYVLQACEAIAEAHVNGIIHRDLKPRNLFVTTAVDGRPLVKVLDFGISKHSSGVGSNSDMSLTKTSSVMGSPNYMSPEQLRSSKLVDVRTDIWALGVILYEVLTGAVPFVAETVTQLTAMVLQDAPRPVEHLRPEVSPALARVIYACLDKDPAKRPQNVAELAKMLEGCGGNSHAVQRVEQVTLRSRGAPSAPGSSAKVIGGNTGGTSVAWGATELATTARKKGAMVAVAAALVTLGIVSTGIVIGVRSMRAAGGPGPELETVPTTRQIELAQPPVTPPAPTVAPPPTVVPVVAATATTPPIPTPSAAPPTPQLKPQHHPPSPPRPKPAQSPDDLPTERN